MIKNDTRLTSKNTVEKCQNLCNTEAKCKAFEFTNGKCKVFYHKQKGTGPRAKVTKVIKKDNFCKDHKEFNNTEKTAENCAAIAAAKGPTDCPNGANHFTWGVNQANPAQYYCGCCKVNPVTADNGYTAMTVDRQIDTYEISDKKACYIKKAIDGPYEVNFVASKKDKDGNMETRKFKCGKESFEFYGV